MTREFRTDGSTRSLAFAVRKAAFLMDKLVNRTLAAKGGLTLSQVMIAHVLREAPGITQRALASSLDLTEAAVSRQAETMRRRGYVTRTTNPASRRERVLALTPAGRRALSGSMRHVLAAFEAPFGTFGVTERKAAARALARLLASLVEECHGSRALGETPDFACK